MTVRSLGYRTDLLVARFDAEVEDRGDRLAVRTPANRAYHWGNFLLFDRPPAEGDLPRWTKAFAEEIGTPPEVRHVAFGWDAPGGEIGDVQPFLDAGFLLDESVVLQATEVRRPEKYGERAEVRPLTEDWEWQAALECQVATRDPIYAQGRFHDTLASKMERYRRMTQAGLGQWFGAFLDGRLAGDLGLFVFEGLGRFQWVETHPDFRRQGVCGALVHQAAERAFATLGAETLVIVGEAHYHAVKIYESVGFAPVERQSALLWIDREETDEV